MLKDQIPELILEIEGLVRGGNADSAALKLRKLNPKQLSRAQLLLIANLARRCGENRMALKILNGLVRSEKVLEQKPSDQEKVEYAEALRKAGLLEEATNILTEVDTTAHPQAFLYLALCHFSSWRYDQAIPLLQSFIANHTPAQNYLSLVAKVNLAAALVHEEQLDEAERLLEELKSTTREGKHLLLLTNCLELSAQLHIQRRDWLNAEFSLTVADELLVSTQSVDRLYIEKWKAVVKSLKSQEAAPELQRVRELATLAQHWETIRDCDYYTARIKGDHQLLEYLYVGTPHLPFRRRILREPNVRIPSVYHWSGSALQVSPMPKVLHLATGTAEGLREELTTGQVAHRMLILLCQDFYRPLPVLTAFAKLFPGEFLNPKTSAGRVHQAVKRLREWFEANHLPLSVEEVQGNYVLAFHGGISIQVDTEPSSGPSKLSQKSLALTNLLKSIEAPDFSAAEAQLALGDSLATTKRLLKWAVENQFLEIVGGGAKTRYRRALPLASEK